MPSYIYVENISTLLLPRLVSNEPKLPLDLPPKAKGKITEEMFASAKVQGWLASKRLKVLTEEEFNQTPEELAEKAASAKVTIVKDETGTVTVNPILDELPSTNEIPSPLIENLAGVVVVKAPTAGIFDAPRQGDPVVLEKDFFDPNNPKEVGKTVPKPIVPALPPAPVVNATPELFTDSTPDSEEGEAETENPAPAPALPVVSASTPPTTSTIGAIAYKTPLPPAAQKILELAAWKQQVKKIEACTDSDVLQAVSERTVRETVKKACVEQLAKIKK